MHIFSTGKIFSSRIWTTLANSLFPPLVFPTPLSAFSDQFLSLCSMPVADLSPSPFFFVPFFFFLFVEGLNQTSELFTLSFTLPTLPTAVLLSPVIGFHRGDFRFPLKGEPPSVRFVFPADPHRIRSPPLKTNQHGDPSSFSARCLYT